MTNEYPCDAQKGDRHKILGKFGLDKNKHLGVKSKCLKT